MVARKRLTLKAFRAGIVDIFALAYSLCDNPSAEARAMLRDFFKENPVDIEVARAECLKVTAGLEWTNRNTRILAQEFQKYFKQPLNKEDY